MQWALGEGHISGPPVRSDEASLGEGLLQPALTLALAAGKSGQPEFLLP